MKSIFEPLLHANAKAFAILAALLFAGMLGWGAYTEYAARRDAAAAAAEAARRSDAPLPEFPAAEPIGLLAYVDSQTATGTEDAHLPVDLFRPPVDSEGHPTRPGITLPVVASSDQPAVAQGAETEVPKEIEDLFQQAQTGGGGGGGFGPWSGGGVGGGGGQPRPRRNHELQYGGVFKRTDGTLAAWVSDKGTGKGGFVKEGDEIGGATILGGDTDKLRIRLPDGTETDLVRGGESVVTTPMPPEPGEEGRQRQRMRRLPTESEIKEIEKRDPELAKRIRDAIRRHNERQAKGGN